MVIIETFTDYQIDALKELANIGMGRAGAKLSEVFEHRVTLNVPNVAMVDADKLDSLARKAESNSPIINIIQQAFIGDIEGRSTFIIGGHNFTDLVEILGYEESDAVDERRQKEMLLDISNAVNSACLSGLAEQLTLDIELTNPSIIAFNKENIELKDFFFKQKDQQTHQTLLFEIKFFIKDIDLYCDNIISLKISSLKNLRVALERLL
ncbi:chemotaxis protein CheC [Psychromonas antarctica]|uniref:chemotaxis protein CheC n=1 Tax=Psychromonas antarctica TaxID=67573 RepID=UPI001EE9562A|nr:chemotaxis protein CheC [Psychromonas antarctica]MCG6200788.1 chemotaxis protein CheC [Psychromonas antarctica]